MVGSKMECRSCEEILRRTFIDLGKSPIANDLLTAARIQESEIILPLHVMTCDNCGLVQLPEVASRETLFPENYLYFSSFSKSWLKHSKSYAEKMISKLDLTEDDLVIEVASNDGYLLQYFKKEGIPVLGIEPALDVANSARLKGIKTIVDFFGISLIEKILSTHKKPKLLIGNNVLAHVPNIHDFIAGFSALLADDGTITFEFPHLLNLIKFNQFDTIYHEHYSYLSVTALIPIFTRHDLKIIEVEELSTHGGSLRLTLVKKDSLLSADKSVVNIMNEEAVYDPRKDIVIEKFTQSVENCRKELLKELKTAKAKGLNVVAYGAAAKGNTLLNYANITSELVSYVVDLNPNKQNMYLPGSHIPVTSDSSLKTNPPDVILVLPWNLSREIKEQLVSSELGETRFLRAIPNVEYF
jgi:hypothetical protein